MIGSHAFTTTGPIRLTQVGTHWGTSLIRLGAEWALGLLSGFFQAGG